MSTNVIQEMGGPIENADSTFRTRRACHSGIHSNDEHHRRPNPKTLKEYAGYLRHFIHWFEATGHHEESVIFRIEDVSTPTISRYRETSQKSMELKPTTVNRRLLTLKRFFSWAAAKSHMDRDTSKPVKLVPDEKTKPRQMTDREESALMAAVERGGSVRDRTILIVMLHTGLRTMEVCDLTSSDMYFGRRSGQLLVRSGKRNKPA